MSTKAVRPPVFNLPGQSQIIRAYGEEVHFHLTTEHTGGKFTLFTAITPPGGGPPPHCHAVEDETFFVLEGRVEYFLDGKWKEIPAGSTTHIPAGILHGFRNPGDQPLKQLISLSPSGFEVFFAKSEIEFQRPGGPDMERITAIAAEHGISFPET